MLIRVFLDTKRSNQGLSALKHTFENFARKKGRSIASFYNSREPAGARTRLFQLLRDKGLAIASQGGRSADQKNACEELFRLLDDSRPNDVLLVERASSLAQLANSDWADFRQRVKQRKIRIVSLDVEASWVMMSGESAMTPVAEHLSSMMLDMLEALILSAQKDKRHRHIEGVARAKSRGKYQGRPVDHEKHEKILSLLQEGFSWSEVCKKTGASRSTVARAVKSVR